MKGILTALALIATLAAPLVHAQTTLSAPYMAACPSPVPPTWPASSCKYQFYPVDSTLPNAVASVSKTAPAYAHSYSGYVAAKFAGSIVACPKNAILSADKTKCLDAAGADASGLVTLASLPAFAITAQTPPPPPPPPADDYSTIVNYTLEHSYDGGTTWDSISTTITYPTQTTAHCFRVTPHRKDGDGPGQVVCPKPK